MSVSSRRRLEHEAFSAHRANRATLPWRAELASEPAENHVEAVRRRLRGLVPGTFEKIVAAHDASRSGNQDLEDRPFASGERHLPVAARESAGREVDPSRSCLDARGRGL